MVYFKDKSSPSGEHHLIILDDQHQPIEKGTILAVYAPLVGGRNVSPWPRLTNSFYLDEWSQEVSLSKNVTAWILRATYHELPRHQQSNDLVDDDQCSNVSIDKWVKFWSKKAIKYHLPPPRKEKKTVQPKSTHNPLSDITTHKRWSIAEEALFEKLCIEGNLKEEVYLTTYLACWLCTFVLPGKDVNSIRQASSRWHP
ncbi:UNVERIFIED_CONTAM: hypothetical protein Slati_2737200 [Sesamum latifolium]|uniref:Aminotransferase-like plant mobile domain-containing protein n=1 Tax=Sesamum latifolium TaxID=2727402 RepID=A0AAW2VWI5_9LAMI